MVDINVSKTFNSWIKEAREKPIISMLEHIRIQVMNKIVENIKSVNKWINEWSLDYMAKYQ